MWIAIQYNDEKKTWGTCQVFNKIYDKPAHIKNAIANSNSGASDYQWEIAFQTPEVIECRLVTRFFNPLTRKRSRIRVNNGRVVFVNIAQSVRSRLKALQHVFDANNNTAPAT